jgi:hypothetical protein
MCSRAHVRPSNMCDRAHVRPSTCATEHMCDRAHVRPSNMCDRAHGRPSTCDRAGSRGGSGGLPPTTPSLARFLRNRAPPSRSLCTRFALASHSLRTRFALASHSLRAKFAAAPPPAPSLARSRRGRAPPSRSLCTRFALASRSIRCRAPSNPAAEEHLPVKRVQLTSVVTNPHLPHAGSPRSSRTRAARRCPGSSRTPWAPCPASSGRSKPRETGSKRPRRGAG